MHEAAQDDDDREVETSGDKKVISSSLESLLCESIWDEAIFNDLDEDLTIQEQGMSDNLLNSIFRNLQMIYDSFYFEI